MADRMQIVAAGAALGAIATDALAQDVDGVRSAAVSAFSAWWFWLGVALFVIAAFLSFSAWTNTRHFKLLEDRLNRSATRLRRSEDSLQAVLLERADGAAIWSKDGIEIAAGQMEPLRHLENPLDPGAVAAALTREESRDALAVSLGQLLAHGIGFDEMFADHEGTLRSFVGRALGTRALVTIGDSRRGSEALISLSDRLDHSEERVAALEASYAEAPVFAWRRDAKGHLVWMNERFVKGVEAPSLETAIDCQIELLSGEGGEKLRDLAASAREENERKVERHPAIIDGERKTLEISEVPSGKGTVGFALDVSAQAAASEALLRQIRANAETLGRLRGGVAHFGTGGRLEYYNDALAKLLRLEDTFLDTHPTLSQLLTALRGINRVPHSRNFNAWRDDFLKQIENISGTVERNWHLSDAMLHMVAQPHPLGGTLMLFEDATNLYALKRDAATANAVHRSAFSRLNEGVIVLGLDGRCSLANEAFARIWNIPQKDLENAHVSKIAELCKPLFDEPAVWRRIIGHVSAASASREIWSETLKRKDGKVLGLATAPLPDGATMFAFRDVTDTHNMERMLRVQNATLEEASRLKGQFLNSIHDASHELKIPLNTIVGFSEMMMHEMSGELNTSQHEYIDGIYAAANELRQLVGSIIDLAMLEGDFYTFRLESIRVRDVLDSIVQFLHRNGGNRVNVRFDCPQAVGEIPGDLPRFREIAYTLLNAFRNELEDGAPVEIGIRRNAGQVTIWMGCTNASVPASIRDVLLQRPFGDGMPEMRRAALRITLVRQFIERQGGSIAVERGIGRTREAVVYHMLTDAEAVRAAISRERMLPVLQQGSDAAE